MLLSASISTQSYMHALGFEAYFPNTHRSSSTHTTATTTICSECQSWEGSESSPMIFQTDTPGHCHGGGGGVPQASCHIIHPSLHPCFSMESVGMDGQDSFGKKSSDPQEGILCYPGVTELPPPISSSSSLPPPPSCWELRESHQGQASMSAL